MTQVLGPLSPEGLLHPSAGGTAALGDASRAALGVGVPGVPLQMLLSTE